MSKVTQQRKDQHLDITIDQDVDSDLSTGLERYRFLHRALPELDLAAINTELTLFGKNLKTPIFISSMTGGTERAREINCTLATAAQQYGMAMGVGSQRAIIEDRELAQTFQVRGVAPDILLFANVGAVQLNYGFGVDECRKVVEIIEADALILHFNPLQEAVQPEGDTNFANLIDKVAVVCRALDVPVIAKEVGWGFAPQDARMLAEAGVSAIDVAGSGGTSWSQVESFRSMTAAQQEVARSFADWGIPTADAIRYVREAAPQMTIFASGGLRTGIDAAKCIALGATLTGMAGPFVRAVAESEAALHQTIDILQSQLRIAMFASGAADLRQLAALELIS